MTALLEQNDSTCKASRLGLDAPAAWQEEAQRQAIVADILAGLGRPATVVDRIAADNLASFHIKARRLEAQGKSSVEVRRVLNQAMRASGPKPAEPEAPRPMSIQEMLAARGFTPPAAPTASAALEQSGIETSTQRRPQRRRDGTS
jgi:hypothetical protein